METRKVPSKLHFRKFVLNDLKQYHLIKKLNLKNVNYTEMSIDKFGKQMDSSLLEFKQFLLKRKAYNTLDFTNVIEAFQTMKIEKQILIMKKQSRIKKLIIPLGSFSSGFVDIKTTVLWIRNIKGLKVLGFKVPSYMYNPGIKNLNNELIFWKAIKRHRLEVLNVDTEYFMRQVTNFVFKLSNAPSTIKELCLKNACGELNSITNDAKVSLSSLKGLKSLSLSLYPNLELWKTLFTSIPNPNQLLKLCINIPHKLTKDFILSYFPLQENNQLRILELMFEEAPSDLGKFVKAFQNKKLKILKVIVRKISLTPRKSWYWIVDLLNNNPDLKKIKIGLSYPVDETNSEEKFYKSLIKAISKLKSLKKLKLSLNDTVPNSAAGSVFSVKELYKLKNIEEISFESNCLVVQMWDDFVDLSEKFAPNLKKLKLNLGKTTPDMNYLKRLRKFIRSLKVLEVLKFKRFEIPSSKFWKEFVCCLTELKNLRKLELGRLNITDKEFDQGILSLLSISSFKKIEYWQSYNYYGLKNISIENPFDRKQLIYDLQKKEY